MDGESVSTGSDFEEKGEKEEDKIGEGEEEAGGDKVKVKEERRPGSRHALGKELAEQKERNRPIREAAMVPVIRRLPFFSLFILLLPCQLTRP